MLMRLELKELYGEWKELKTDLMKLYIQNGYEKSDIDNKISDIETGVEKVLVFEGTEEEFIKRGYKQLANVEIKKINEDIYLMYMTKILEKLNIVKNEELEREAKELLKYRNSLIEKNVLDRVRELYRKAK